MWLPSNEPEIVIKGSLKRSHMPELGYIRILDKGNESVLFIREGKILGAWHLNIESLKECYENKAMEMMVIRPESKIEIYKMGTNLFETIIELNEEAKLSIQVEIDFITEKYNANSPVGRNKLLLKYGIREPSEDDLETLLNRYTE